MARIRTIKPEFFTSEDIVRLSPLARLLYIALWCEADKEGRLVWKPATFKLRYLPGDSCDIAALCTELVDAGLVRLYGEGLAHIPQFGRHQHTNPRESASVLPAPTRQVDDASARVPHAQGGRERKGKERKGNTPQPPKGGRVHPFPPGFEEFWRAYPNRKAKDAAAKAFAKREVDATLLAQMIDAIDRQKRSDEWLRDEGRYIPHPATWLNQARWQDEAVVQHRGVGASDGRVAL